MTAVDVGANVGYYTLLAASCVGVTGKCLLWSLAICLPASIRGRDANGLSQVLALQVALSSDCGEGVLYLPPHGNHTPSLVPSDRKDSVRVSLADLDGCLDEWGVHEVDLLKIDVEGFDQKVLAGAYSARGLEEYVPFSAN